MTSDEANRVVRQKWMKLPLAERQTESQAAAFAFSQLHQVSFRCSSDPYQVMKGWLTHDLETTRHIG